MLRSLSWRAFLELQAFEILDPTETFKEDGRNAHIVATLVNLRRDPERYPDPHPIANFLLKWGEDATVEAKKKEKPKEKTWQQLKLIGQVLAASYNMMEESDRQIRERREAKRKAKRG